MGKADQDSADFNSCIFSSNQMQKIENGIKDGLFYYKAFLLLCNFFISEVNNQIELFMA